MTSTGAARTPRQREHQQQQRPGPTPANSRKASVERRAPSDHLEVLPPTRRAVPPGAKIKSANPFDHAAILSRDRSLGGAGSRGEPRCYRVIENGTYSLRAGARSAVPRRRTAPIVCALARGLRCRDEERHLLSRHNVARAVPQDYENDQRERPKDDAEARPA